MDQNREGLILIKLEDFGTHDSLEAVAPQLNFLLKTRVYLDWNSCAEEIFWKKLRRSLGVTTYAPYDAVKNYYQSHWFKKNTNRIKTLGRKVLMADSVEASTAAAFSLTFPSTPSSSSLNHSKRKIEYRDVLVPPHHKVLIQVPSGIS